MHVHLVHIVVRVDIADMRLCVVRLHVFDWFSSARSLIFVRCHPQ